MFTFYGFLSCPWQCARICPYSVVHHRYVPAVYVRIEGRATEESLLNERRFRIAVIDITERKQAEEMLRESEEQLSALYASMVEGGVALQEIVCDKAENPLDCIIADVNPSYEKITGLTRDKALGQRASSTISILGWCYTATGID